MVAIKKVSSYYSERKFFFSQTMAKLLLEMDENVGRLINECIGESDF